MVFRSLKPSRNLTCLGCHLGRVAIRMRCPGISVFDVEIIMALAYLLGQVHGRLVWKMSPAGQLHAYVANGDVFSFT